MSTRFDQWLSNEPDNEEIDDVLEIAQAEGYEGDDVEEAVVYVQEQEADRQYDRGRDREVTQ